MNKTKLKQKISFLESDNELLQIKLRNIEDDMYGRSELLERKLSRTEEMYKRRSKRLVKWYKDRLKRQLELITNDCTTTK